MKEIKLYSATQPTGIEAYPAIADCLVNADGFENKLLPLLRIEGGLLHKKWQHIPFCFITHDISGSRIDFRIENGKYRVLQQEEDLQDADDFDEIEAENGYLQTTPASRETMTYETTEIYDHEGRLVAIRQNRLRSTTRQNISYATYNGNSLPSGSTEQLATGNGTWTDLNLRHFEYDAEGFLVKDTSERTEQALVITARLRYTPGPDGLRIDLEKEDYQHFPEEALHHRRPGRQIFPVHYLETPETWTFNRWDDTSWSYQKSTKTDFDLKQTIRQLATEHFFEHYSQLLRYEAIKDTAAVNFADAGADLPETVQFTLRTSAERKEIHFTCTEKTDRKITLTTDYDTTTFEHQGDTITVERTTKDWTRNLQLDGRFSLQQAIIQVENARNFWYLNPGIDRDETFQPRPSFYTGQSPYAFRYRKTDEGTERMLFSLEIETDDHIGTINIDTPEWMQDDETPLDPDGNPMEFVGELEHDSLFGVLYLFYSEKYQQVSQIFQCT